MEVKGASVKKKKKKKTMVPQQLQFRDGSYGIASSPAHHSHGWQYTGNEEERKGHLCASEE